MTIDLLCQTLRFGSEEEFWARFDPSLLNSVDRSQENLLHCAIAYEKEKIARQLIALGINVNHQDRNGHTALHYLAEKNMCDLAAKIIAHSGDLSIEDKYGNQPLWTATFSAREEYSTVRLFVEMGGDPNHRGKQGYSPLDIAKEKGDGELIAILEKPTVP